jgi:hypothetical protein
MSQLALIALLLWLAVWGAICPAGGDRRTPPPSQQEGTSGMETSPLALAVQSEAASFRLGSPIPVRVTLRNVSSQPVWVNQRLGMGYEDDLIRELYFTVFDASSGQVLPVPDTARVDAHRLPPTRDDFRQLEPGGEVVVNTDLAFWYPFERPGPYRVVVSYENRDDGQAFGLRAFTGRVDADPIEFGVA